MEFLPFLLFTLPAGVWVDRLRRRPILVVADFGRAVAARVRSRSPMRFDALTIWQLFAVGFAVGTLTVFFDVAYQSYLPSLVEREQLVEGNSKLEISRSGGADRRPRPRRRARRARSPPPSRSLLDAVSFVVSALLLRRIRTTEERPEPTASSAVDAARARRRGSATSSGHPYWRPIAVDARRRRTSSEHDLRARSSCVYARPRRSSCRPRSIGLVLTLGSLGGLAAVPSPSRLSRALGVGPTIVGRGVLFGPPLLLVPLAPQSLPAPLARRVALRSLGFGGHRLQHHRAQPRADDSRPNACSGG